MRFTRISLAICLLLALTLVAAFGQCVELPISSNFGWRYHPISGEWSFHSGLDLAYDYYTPVPAMFDGEIYFTGDLDDGYGIQVLVYHPQFDSFTRYAHLIDICRFYGDQVYQGETIGLVGSTGNSTGPHLHLEYIARNKDGVYQFYDPLSIFDEQ